MTFEQAPILSLRMKNVHSGAHYKIEHDDAVDLLRVMLSQELRYRCQDYLERRAKSSDGDVFFDSTDDVTALDTEDGVDITCREKMCEWSFRVVDHFHVSREIVALSFSFLDRFIDRCSCDRTAFKLASMTSLYMATKILNAKQISISSLAELSRGEFEMSHLAEMERIILEALEWRLCPPTVQSFIGYLLALLRTEDPQVAQKLYQRAVFFGELCVYDYTFVTMDRSVIAVVCVLNALEGIEDDYLSQDLRRNFMGTIGAELSLEVDAVKLERGQGRLWYLYSCSAQEKEDHNHLPLHVSKERLVKQPTDIKTACFVHSPVSVNMQ